MNSRTITTVGVFGSITVLVIMLVLTSTVIIGTGKIGVVTQFGKVTGRELNPGLNFKAPWPFQSVWVADNQIQKDQQAAEAASSDLQVVHSTLALNYNLDHTSASTVYSTIGPDYKERIIDPAIQETFKAITSQYTASDLIVKRPEVKSKALDLLKARLNSKGITVDDLSIVNFDFSGDFNKAIEAKQVAQQQAEQAKYDADKATQEAQADINRAKGAAEAQKLQQQTLTPELLQKYAIDKWDGKMPQYVGSGSVFNIPLTK